MRAAQVCLTLSICLLSGCSALVSSPDTTALSYPDRIQGIVHGGQQPVSGARVYLYAAGTGGYGTAARQMLNGAGYVITDAAGSFGITGAYTCAAGDQVYLLALGGNPGLAAGTDNSALALTAALGPCSALTSATVVNVNEVTTVAAAYGLSAFMTSASNLGSSSTTLALSGLRNAFGNAANLASFAQGTARTVTAGGNGSVPAAEINTLADIIAACVNSSGAGMPCSSLFAATTPSGGSAPANTVQAVLNIAHNPNLNTAALYALAAANAPFQPTLSGAPADWSMTITYTGGGIGTSSTCASTECDKGLAIDAAGNIWSAFDHSIAVLTPNGTPLSPANGFSLGLGSTDSIQSIALDSANNAWSGVLAVAADGAQSASRIVEYNSAGTVLSPVSGYAGGGVGTHVAATLAFDSGGDLWSAGSGLNSSGTVAASQFSAAGAPISPDAGYPAGSSVVFTNDSFGDAAGNFWVGGHRFSSGGTVSAQWNCGYDHTNGIDAAGLLYSTSEALYVGSPAILICNGSGARVGTYPAQLSELQGTAVAGDNSVWYFTNGRALAVASMTTTGTQVSLATVPGNHDPADYMALDGSGNIWLLSDEAIYQIMGIAAPVVTPAASATAGNRFGQRP